MELIYLDHNATTPLHPDVKQTIIDSLDVYGNASSLHPFGFEARTRVEAARKRVLNILNATEGQVIFTSSGSEANNLALKGLVCAGRQCRHTLCNAQNFHYITSQVEHPSVYQTFRCLKHLGADVTYVPVDRYGMVDPDDIRAAIQPNTVLVSVMMGNNEVGTIQPIREIGAITRQEEIAFHVDAVQAVGKLPISVDEMNIDLLSLSGHKLNAPKGIGALYARQAMTLCPLIHGGHQELNLRAGTENTLGIFALGKALEIALTDGQAEAAHSKHLRDTMFRKLSEKLDGIHLNGHPEQRLPGTLNISFDRIDGAAILEMLAMQGIAVSSGSACSSGEESPSHVLTAMGLPPEAARSAIRISFGLGNTDDDVEKAAGLIVQTVSKLRALSPIKG
ncbi:MAG TPA: cysteine desulfurase family protein [bacterium]|nr:cysteine desulfurase family protein [bacterium]